MIFKRFRKFVLWEVINPLILSFRPKKKYKVKTEVKGLNIGCGTDNPTGWIGIDGGLSSLLIKVFPKFIIKRIYKDLYKQDQLFFDDFYAGKSPHYHYELLKGLPFADNSIPHVFSSHFFEHLQKKDAQFLLNESFRVMKSHGIIRVCVPALEDDIQEMEEAIAVYKQGDVSKVQRFVTIEEQGYLPAYSFHRWMYNFENMKKSLEQAGFTQVQQFSFKEGNIPDVDGLDTRGGLIVEAVKP